MTEITTTHVMKAIAKRIGRKLASHSPDIQLEGQQCFSQHASAMNAYEYSEFADAVKIQKALAEKRNELDAIALNSSKSFWLSVADSVQKQEGK